MFTFLIPWPFIQFINLNFIVKMADVTNYGLVFHFVHMIGRNNIIIACCGNINIRLRLRVSSTVLTS